MNARMTRVKKALVQLALTCRAALRKVLQAPASSAALAELRAHGSVLPILTRQLEEASQDMEAEVSKVCRSFQGMALRAIESVRNATRVLDTGSGDSELATVIQGCRETMLTLLDRMEQSEELSRRAIQRMEQVDASVAQVSHALQELDRSAFSNKIVALNAKIEAVHIGDAGRGFEVVAEEISTQASRSAQITGQVADILSRLVGDAREAIRDLRSSAAADREWIQSSRHDVNHLLAEMERANTELRASLESASLRSQELAGDIEQALVTLQFQDRVSQRIQHVTHSLASMHRAVTEPIDSDSLHAPDERHREIAERLTASYTMNCERAAHANAGSAQSATDETDVELF